MAPVARPLLPFSRQRDRLRRVTEPPDDGRVRARIPHPGELAAAATLLGLLTYGLVFWYYEGFAATLSVTSTEIGVNRLDVINRAGEIALLLTGVFLPVVILAVLAAAYFWKILARGVVLIAAATAAWASFQVHEKLTPGWATDTVIACTLTVCAVSLPIEIAGGSASRLPRARTYTRTALATSTVALLLALVSVAFLDAGRSAARDLQRGDLDGYNRSSWHFLGPDVHDVELVDVSAAKASIDFSHSKHIYLLGRSDGELVVYDVGAGAPFRLPANEVEIAPRGNLGR